MAIYDAPAPRLEPVLHYVIARSIGCGFGAIKLNKAVFASDREFFRRYGKTITGATSYQKQQFGPVPNGVLKALKQLRSAGKISKAEVVTPTGVRVEYSSPIEPDVSEFSASEVDVLNIAIASLQRVTANEASEQTHDALWDEIELLHQIPISAAAFAPVPVDSDILAWAISEERSQA